MEKLTKLIPLTLAGLSLIPIAHAEPIQLKVCPQANEAPHWYDQSGTRLTDLGVAWQAHCPLSNTSVLIEELGGGNSPVTFNVLARIKTGNTPSGHFVTQSQSYRVNLIPGRKGEVVNFLLGKASDRGTCVRQGLEIFRASMIRQVASIRTVDPTPTGICVTGEDPRVPVTERFVEASVLDLPYVQDGKVQPAVLYFERFIELWPHGEHPMRKLAPTTLAVVDFNATTGKTTARMVSQNGQVLGEPDEGRFRTAWILPDTSLLAVFENGYKVGLWDYSAKGVEPTYRVLHDGMAGVSDDGMSIGSGYFPDYTSMRGEQDRERASISAKQKEIHYFGYDGKLNAWTNIKLKY